MHKFSRRDCEKMPTARRSGDYPGALPAGFIQPDRTAVTFASSGFSRETACVTFAGTHHVGPKGCENRAAYGPGSILPIVYARPERLAAMPIGELRIWADRITGAIRRERAKSVMRHWSYDLNRHIALKQARDRIAGELERRTTSRPQTRKPRARPRLRNPERPVTP